MFEEYNINDVYFCQIEDYGGVIGMENIGGAISITAIDKPKYYETLVYKKDNKYIDLYHKNRIINPPIEEPPTRNMPEVSKNHHLYTIIEDTLVKYKNRIDTKDAKVLKRGILNRYKIIKGS